jgi:hypothetical protein
MLIKLMRMLEMISGYLLGSLCAGVQIGNVLICLFIVLMVPAVLVGWVGQ